MKPLSLLLTFIFSSTAFISTSFAEGIELKADEDEHNSAVTVSFESAQFTLPAGAITGMGGKIEYTRYVTSRISVDPFFAMAFGTTGGVSSTFTGFGGYVNYTLFGDCCTTKRSVSLEGRSVITEEKPRTQLLRVGVGFDQVFLNGDKAVYPASGIGVGASYDFTLFGRGIRLAARTSMMTANEQSIQALFISGGLLFPF